MIQIVKQLFNRTVVANLPAVPRSLVWRFSKRYIAGTDIQSALDIVERLNKEGMSATLDVLGEDATKPESAQASCDLYLKALDDIEKRKLDCNISVKLSQMALRIDPNLCNEIVDSLAKRTASMDNFLRIDMEDSSVTQVTLDIYRKCREQFPASGTVVQAYLKRTQDDVAKLLAEGPTYLRLCKGIYVESADIAFQEREEVRNSFRELLKQMFEGGIKKVGIATHDPALIESSLECIRELGIPKDRYEFQMLLGVAERERKQLLQDGHPLRVYVPFGEEW